MKIIKFLTLTVLLLTFTSCNSDPTNDPSVKSKIVKELTEEELKEQLHKTECSSPTNYLGGELSYVPIYKNLFSSKIKGVKLTLKISNSSTLATFKDIDISLNFISKTGTSIMKESIIIYEFIKPNKTIKYKNEIEISNQQYKDLNEISWTIRDAVCN